MTSSPEQGGDVVFAWQELVGSVASALVVTSLSMTSVMRLRLISLTGSSTFVVYGLLIGSVPILLTNGSIALLNLWFPAREFRGERDLGAVVVPSDSPFLRDFLHHHAADIWATGATDLEAIHTSTLREAGRGEQWAPSGVRIAWYCWDCTGRDVTSPGAVPGPNPPPGAIVDVRGLRNR